MGRSENLTREVEQIAQEAGADLVGFADVAEFTALPRAVVVAIRHSPNALVDPEDMPNPDYAGEYATLNEKLTAMAERIAARLQEQGYRTSVNAATVQEIDPQQLAAPFSHKLAATRAGLGWIGKSALLVTPEFGPAIRLATVLTDAPLLAAKPTEESACGDCLVCVEACPGRAIQGRDWHAGMPREQLLDAQACHQTRPAASVRHGIERPRCGVCMAVCPLRPR
ncbi:MAG: epoxyqueuosine reductase [Armatimonadetes bacterium]|nr:epoxyqueuosine reductase [Armatimonadota bacterium]